MENTSQTESVPEITIPQSAEIVKERVSKLSVVPNWKSVLKTYSFYFYLSSILITLVDQILPLLTIVEPIMSGNTYVVLVFSLNILGVISRFIQQRKLWEFSPTDVAKNE